MNKVLVTPIASYEIDQGILIIRYVKGLVITYAVAKEIVKTRHSFTENTTYPLLILDEGVLSIDKQARDLLSSREGTRNLSASALVFDSAYGAIAGNVFVRLIRTPIPVKIFREKEKAIQWLEQYKKI